MEIQANQNEENKRLTEIRNPEIDIIKGASNTDQIQAMQANAAQSPNSVSVKKANILEVNDGGTPNDEEDTPSEDLENPATRGI